MELYLNGQAKGVAMRSIVFVLSCAVACMVLSFSLSVPATPCNGDFNCDADVDGSDAGTFKADFGRSAFNEPCDPCATPAPLPSTGQSVCYDTEGTPRSCSGTGEDGEHQKGIASPDPRFTDHGDGTVTDNLTGLMWTKDAQLIPGTMPWQAALDACNNLIFANYEDWRLPNLHELQSLIDYSRFDPALPVGHPFINQLSALYWSSSTTADSPFGAWILYFSVGRVYGSGKGNAFSYVRAVRGGR